MENNQKQETNQEVNMNQEIFQYTYSAKEQDEIQKIRSKYIPKEENKMDKLRRLDESVNQKATMWSIIVGTIGALIMGSGMSLCMTDIGTILGMNVTIGMVIGIVLGLIGIVLVGFAYPVYRHILRKERDRIAPEILKITEELLK